MRRISGSVLLVPLLALAACNSLDPTFGMKSQSPAPADSSSPRLASLSADQAQPAAPGAASAAAAATQAAQPGGQPGQGPARTNTASVSRAVKLNIAPVVGAPVSAVAALSHRLQEDARARGIQISGDSDPGTTYVLKGYFSTLSEGGGTTVLYVWDVLDASGNRLHRIQGQEQVGGTAADPWTVVAPQTMEAIGDATVQSLIQWINASPA